MNSERDELKRSGQGHIVRHMDSLEGELRERLARQLGRFDYTLVRELRERARRHAAAEQPGEFEPAPVVRAGRPDGQTAASRRVGEEAIRNGEAAAFVAAGGQGTRLRYDGPKGCYPIGPISGKSLFQIHAEKILASARRYAAAIPFCVMTSETNDEAVRAFFREERFFGLSPNDVFFCVQRMLPAFDREGRFLLDEAGHVFCSPDGHGGAFFALQSSGALADMKRRGIRHISYFQVDNPLVPVIDPLFIGEHIRTSSEMSSKVLAKREPLEKLGVFGRFGGRLRVIEYSDMSEELQRRTLPDGSLKYAFGSIAIHVVDAGFAERMGSADLPFHVAVKRVPCLNEKGERVEPDKANAVKFERFIFDAIPLARNPLVMEVRREDEFAPVKNISGEDSAETARAAMMDQHRRWLWDAGLDVPANVRVEISPLLALDADEVRAKARGLEVRDPLYLG